MVCSSLQNYRGESRPHLPGEVFEWDMSLCDCCANPFSGETGLLLHWYGNTSWEETRGRGWVSCGVMERSCYGSWSNEGDRCRSCPLPFTIVRWWKEVVVIMGGRGCCHSSLWSNEEERWLVGWWMGVVVITCAVLTVWARWAGFGLCMTVYNNFNSIQHAGIWVPKQK